MFASTALALATALAAAAPQVDPEPPPPARIHRELLLGEAARTLRGANSRRADAAAAEATAREWQQRTRDALRKRFAPLPAAERAAPEARVVRSIPRDGLRIEHLLIASRPGMHVTAHLYVPDSATPEAPAPGILVACGHARDAKAHPLYQRGATTLARAGFVVLIFDPLDQGERLQSRSVPDRWGTQAHNISGLQALLVGWNQAGLQAFDSMRCLDALAARPEVDADRLAMCGNSGGGTQTAQMFALDDRLRAAAPSCYITSFTALLGTAGPQDAEQNLPGQVRAGLDHADYLAVRAPTPALVCAAYHDFFPISGTLDARRAARAIYAARGAADAFGMVVVDAGHGWHPGLIEATTVFFTEHLLGETMRPQCVDAPPLTDDDDILVTPGGRVLDLEGERSVFDLIAGEADRARALREQTPPAARVELARNLAGVRPLGALPPVRIVDAPHPDDAERLYVETLPGMHLPAARVAARSEQDPTLLVVGAGAWTPDARAAAATRHDDIQVFLLDPIALGDAAPVDEDAWYGSFGPMARDAALCRLLDRPLLGLQTEHVLATARLLADEGAPVDLWARGPAALAALHAAAFEPDLFRSVDVETPIDGWEDLLGETPPAALLPLAVPRALLGYELSDLRRVLESGR